MASSACSASSSSSEEQNVSKPSSPSSKHISFLSFNPDMLDDEEFWPLSCLEGLCTKLGLSPNGTRDELINRLRVWHVQKFKSTGLHGGNFHLLPVKEKSVPSAFLSPFRPADSTNPNKPILRKRSRYSFNSSGTSSPASVHRRSSSVLRPSTSRTHRKNKKPKSVQFSPYNKVHLLSPRRRASFLSSCPEEEEQDDCCDDHSGEEEDDQDLNRGTALNFDQYEVTN